MNTRMGLRWLLPICLLILSVLACNAPSAPTEATNPPALPTDSTVPDSPTATSETAQLPTPEATQPAAANPTPASPPTASTTLVYYAFTTSPTAESVVVLADQLILTPFVTDIPRDTNEAGNVREALNAMFADPNNAWTGTDMRASGVEISSGAASVTLEGQITAPGDIVIIAARMQILLTVFTEPEIASAVVLLNGENIANLGISHSSEAKPADYAYTRAEIEAYKAENAYIAP